MDDGASLSEKQWMALLAAKDAEIESYRQQLRALDIRLRELERKLQDLQERLVGWEKAYNDLYQRQFRR